MFISFLNSLSNQENASLIEAILDGYEVIFEGDTTSSVMVFWHGGNLSDYKSGVNNVKGRFEYGPGLYLTTHYGTAIKYAKGSRKLYKVSVKRGTDISAVKLSYNDIIDFLKQYAIKSKLKDISSRIEKYRSGDLVPAIIMLNVLINEEAIKPTNTNALREFFVSNGIDYQLVHNAFGWGESMLVLFNMDKIEEVSQINPNDTDREDTPVIQESILDSNIENAVGIEQYLMNRDFESVENLQNSKPWCEYIVNAGLEKYFTPTFMDGKYYIRLNPEYNPTTPVDHIDYQYKTNRDLTRTQMNNYVSEYGMDYDRSFSNVKFVDPNELQPVEDTYSNKVNVIKDLIKSGEELPPVMIDEQGNIMDGHHRLQASKELGINNIPVIVYGLVESYQGHHTAPTKQSSAPLHNLTGIYPDDIYSIDGLRYYGDGDTIADRESLSVIRYAKGNPNASVKIYRAVPNANAVIDKKINNLNKLIGFKDTYGFFPLKDPLADQYKNKYWNDHIGYDKDYENKMINDINKDIEILTAKRQPNLTINAGDWVTLSKTYAKEHGEGNITGPYKILSKTVKAKELYTDGNSINEWGYNP